MDAGFPPQVLRSLQKLDLPEWGPDLSDIDFDDVVYYQKPTDKPARTWEEVPDEIKETFEKLVSQKQSVLIWQALQHSMSQKLFTTT